MRQKVRGKVKIEEKVTERVAENQCQHYWIIEMANGPTSKGVCKYCGEERDFFNADPNLSIPKKDNKTADILDEPDDEPDDDRKS